MKPDQRPRYLLEQWLALPKRERLAKLRQMIRENQKRKGVPDR